jgi:hypothetical protein
MKGFCCLFMGNRGLLWPATFAAGVTVLAAADGPSPADGARRRLPPTGVPPMAPAPPAAWAALTVPTARVHGQNVDMWVVPTWAGYPIDSSTPNL